ncbi:MAG: hypothetical protein O2923_04860 [Verrucomicrobia bacterium]|nr:hypothetical protein [Verrucomicrobiota bacterium]MDA1086766.1 hypothetical protein [Verrucomicrobiota bacterium]
MKHTMLLVAICASVLMLSTRHGNASATTNEFDVVMVAISSTTWQSIKYNIRTGEAWIAGSGKWTPIAEAAKIPEGKYAIKMTALSGDWAAIRYEVNTGDSWQCRGGAWVEIPHVTEEPADQPVDPKSSDEIEEQP